jgi:hypothetical protein
MALEGMEGNLEDLIRTSCYGDTNIETEDMEGREFEKVSYCRRSFYCVFFFKRFYHFFCTEFRAIFLFKETLDN